MSSPGIPNDGSRFWASRGPELTTALTDTMTRMRRDYAAALDLVAEMDQERVAQDAGYSSLAAFLSEILRVTPHKASRMVAQATQVAETVTPTGHLTPAPLPHVRAALREGLVDGEHVDAVADTLKKVPTWASVADRDLVETTLAEQIHHSEWIVEMVGGRPLFYPPKWLDPQRNGIHNTLHHQGKVMIT